MTLKSFPQIIGFLLLIKAIILIMYLLWGIQITISGMVLSRSVIIAGIIIDIILAYLAFSYTKKRR